MEESYRREQIRKWVYNNSRAEKKSQRKLWKETDRKKEYMQLTKEQNGVERGEEKMAELYRTKKKCL